MDHPTVDHGHGVTRPRRKPPRRRCRPTSLLGRSDRPLALLLSSLFFCSETLLSRFLVASQPVRDLLLCARHLFVAARTMGCIHHQTSATASGSVGSQSFETARLRAISTTALTASSRLSV